MPPDQKVDKAEERTYLSTNIDRLSGVLCMLTVTFKYITLSALMLNVVMLNGLIRCRFNSVVMLNLVAINLIYFSIMLNVVL